MEKTTGNARVRARVTGLVQGVGYRYFCKRHADRLGIKGYARNNLDGSVETVGEGNKQNLLLFLEELKKGPSASDVSAVEARWEEPEEKFTFFRML